MLTEQKKTQMSGFFAVCEIGFFTFASGLLVTGFVLTSPGGKKGRGIRGTVYSGIYAGLFYLGATVAHYLGT